jgi:hypothetical protein
VFKRIPRFYSSESDFKAIHHKLKQFNCPFCRTIGNLNLHGFIYGYDKKRRGRRIFCSNRNRRKGCGRTFSLLLAGFLRNFRLTAHELWTFISGLVQGLSKQAAWAQNGVSISESFLYDLSRRIEINKPYIKTRLFSLSAALNNTFIKLLDCFPATNPIAAFQQHFQDNILKVRVRSPVL